jgi:hypothetical protein
MTIEVYSANYGNFDPPRQQIIPIRMFSDATNPLPYRDPRRSAKWWKVKPELACPDAAITIWLDASAIVLVPNLVEVMVDALGDHEALFFRHPYWTSLTEEVAVSRKAEKYDEWPLEEQVKTYREAGMPEEGFLVHTAFIVRRNTPAVRQTDARWWEEMRQWGLQDQISLPYVLAFNEAGLDFIIHEHPYAMGWIGYGHHQGRDVWRED